MLVEVEGAFFDTEDYQVTTKKLGEGSFGEVFVVQRKSDNVLFAAKVIKCQSTFNGIDQMMFLRESLILHSLHHPAIVKFYGLNFHSFKDPALLQPTILTEYLEHGSLRQVLENEKRSLADLNWTATKKYICLLGISHALAYLHKKGIVHRDLKPENILVDENFNPRVCDLGLSKFFPESFSNSVKLIMSGKAGTPLYWAPEFLNDDNIYDPSIDVYAFGIMAFEILTGKQPFSENGKPINIFNLLMKVKSGARPKFEVEFPTKMEAFISRCWSQLPSDRPTFRQIFDELSSVKQFTDYMEEAVDEEEIRNYIENLKEIDEDKKPSIQDATQELEELIRDQGDTIQNWRRIVQLIKQNWQEGDVKAEYMQHAKNEAIYDINLLIQAMLQQKQKAVQAWKSLHPD